MKEGATELPYEPIEEPDEPIAFSESVFGVGMVIAHEDAPDWPNLLLNGDGSTGDSTSFSSYDTDHICSRMGDYLRGSSHAVQAVAYD